MSRKISLNSENPRVLSVIYYACVTLLAPLLWVIEPLHLKPIPMPIFLLTLLQIIVWTIFGRAEYLAHKHMEASTLSIVIKIAPVITLILSLVFFNENLSLTKLSGIALITLASVYVITLSSGKRLHMEKGMGYALITTIFLGIGWVLDKGIASFYGIALMNIIGFGFPAVINGLTPPLTRYEIMTELRRVNWYLPLLASINIIGYAALIKALMIGEASKVSSISSATTPFVIIIAALFLKERQNLRLKFVAGIATCIGIYLLR